VPEDAVVAGTRAGVVVGVDGSAPGDLAVEWAAAEAASRAAPLTLAHCLDPLPALVGAFGAPALAVTPDELTTAATELLTDAAATADQHEPGISTRIRIIDSPAAQGLLDASRGAELIVLGWRGKSAIGGLLLGSTAVQVVTRSQCPTVVVRPEQLHPTGRFAGHVVVGVDGSAASRAALEFAFEHARRHQLPVAAVHVHPHTESDSYFDERLFESHVVDATQPGRALLDAAVDPWMLAFPDVPLKRGLCHGRVPTGLVRAAAGARLMVVGSRGAGGFRGLLLGSTSLAMVQRAPCPVAVVPEVLTAEQGVASEQVRG
jgi:nucleotide-binding universal stress UspA family protein